MYLVLMVVGLALWIAADYGSRRSQTPRIAWRSLGGVLVLSGVIATSVVVIDANVVGHLNRVYLGRDLPEGRIIALAGQNGPQAEVLGPGLHLRFMMNLLYKLEAFPVIEIPAGHYGLLTAKDGEPLQKGQFLASGWPDDQFEAMLDARYFLTHKGQKGSQLSILKPGRYRLNYYLFNVEVKPALDVPIGEVAVIKSNVQELADCSEPHRSAASENLSVPLVKQGCIGIWDKPLMPNRYYLNDLAYSPTLLPTRVQTWSYKGGFTLRKIDLQLGQQGQIEQSEARSVEVAIPPDAADGAVILTVEGWRVPLELRALVQVEPENAPQVVASVGTLSEVEDRIITPVIRSVIRNEAGQTDEPEKGVRGRKVMDLITHRSELEQLVERQVIPEGLKAGVTIKEIRFGDPAIPPELLLASQRKQLAEQLRATYTEEKRAQEERIQTEKARATADQQDELVRSEIAVQVAEQTKLKLQKEGEGEKLRLMEIAAGQKAQAQVLGEDRVVQLAMLKEILAAAKANPDWVKVPTVLVQGEAVQGLTGAAAVLGASSLFTSLKAPATPPADKAAAP